MFPIRPQLLCRALPLLLAILVLLAQTLTFTHRAAHPNNGQRAVVANTANTAGSALDLLFGHTNGAACDEFDAALGLDINPGQYTPDVVAAVYANAAPAAPAQSSIALHPSGLFLARAPPRA